MHTITKKNTHMSRDKIVHKCTIATITVYIYIYICMVIVARAFNILVFFWYCWVCEKRVVSEKIIKNYKRTNNLLNKCVK